MPKPLVSLCIPAYNNEAYICDTIESILAQTYQNIELIIVDDCSKDATLEVIKAYEAKDSRVKVYSNEKNLGMAGNWNKALSLTTGEYVKLICADDRLVPTCIEREVEMFEKYPSAVLVQSDSRLISLDGKKKGFYTRYGHKPLVSGKKVLRAGFFNKDYFGGPQASLIRRSAYEKSGGIDSSFTYIVDYELLAKIAVQGDIAIIREPLNEFRVRHESNTGQVMHIGSAKNKIYLDEHRRLFKREQKALGLSDGAINVAMLIRRLRCIAAEVYLLIMVRK